MRSLRLPHVHHFWILHKRRWEKYLQIWKPTWAPKITNYWFLKRRERRKPVFLSCWASPLTPAAARRPYLDVCYSNGDPVLSAMETTCQAALFQCYDGKLRHCSGYKSFFFLSHSCIRIDMSTATISRGPRHRDVNLSRRVFCSVIRCYIILKSPVHLKNGFVERPNFTS